MRATNALANPRTSRETFALITPVVSGVTPVTGGAPRISSLTLGPNPFSDRVEFQADLAPTSPAGAKAEWAVYDPQGRKVAGEALSPIRTGRIAAGWNARDASGREAAAGVYYLELRYGAEVLRKTLVHLASAAR